MVWRVHQERGWLEKMEKREPGNGKQSFSYDREKCEEMAAHVLDPAAEQTLKDSRKCYN